MNPMGRKLPNSVASSEERSRLSSPEVRNCYDWSSEESSPRYSVPGRYGMKMERQWPFNEALAPDSMLEGGQSEHTNAVFPERVSISGGIGFYGKSRSLLARGSSSSSSSSSTHANFNLNSPTRYSVDSDHHRHNIASSRSSNSVEESIEECFSLNQSDIPGPSPGALNTLCEESNGCFPRSFDLTCKRKPSDSFSGQFYSDGSSSSSLEPETDPLQLGRNRCDGSSMSCSCPLRNFSGLAPCDDLCSHNVGMLRNTVSRSHHGMHEPPSAFNGITRSAAQWFPRQNAALSTNDSGDLRSTPVLSPCSSHLTYLQNQGASMRGSSSLRGTPHVPWTGPLDSTPVNSSGWYSHSYETDQLSLGDGNMRSMRRHGFDHPMYMPSAEMRTLPHEPNNWSYGHGHYGMAPYMRTFPSSNVLPVASLPWFPQRQPTSVNWPRYSDAPSWSLFPPMEAEFRGSPINSMSSPQLSPSRSSYVRDRSFRRPLPMEGEYEQPHSLTHNQRTSAADLEGRHRVISEIRQVLTAIRRGEHVRVEDYMFLDPFYQTMSEMHDMHRDMRLDVDNMSYEELLALEERIGNVSTGLSDETIFKLMKSQKFASSTADDASCESHEPCCICQEDFLNEDDVGTLDCGHVFHFHCIKQWLNVKNLCPICKMNGLVA